MSGVGTRTGVVAADVYWRLGQAADIVWVGLTFLVFVGSQSLSLGRDFYLVDIDTPPCQIRTLYTHGIFYRGGRVDIVTPFCKIRTVCARRISQRAVACVGHVDTA
jgi:hypothetical protein